MTGRLHVARAAAERVLAGCQHVARRFGAARKPGFALPATCVLTFVAIVSIAPFVLTVRTVPPPGHTASGESEDSLTELEMKVRQLEQLLAQGSAKAPANADLAAPAAARQAYQSLIERVALLEDKDADAWERIPSRMPVDSGVLTSPYTSKRMHPILRRVQGHYGIDVAAPRGTPIRAVAAGRIRAIARTPSYGLAIDLDHGNGYLTRYAHADILLVEPGDNVRRGDVIARVGSTGRSTGPHVHFELFRNGWSVDPLPFLMGGELRIAPGTKFGSIGGDS